MSQAGGVPDAWDDDWEHAADEPSFSKPQLPMRVSRAERKAQHQEANKQLWQAAEETERFHFLEAKGGGVPVKTTDFKPTVTVLSRKPQVAKPPSDPSAKMAGLVIDDGDDSEEEERKRKEADFAERQRKAQVEREEKQRKYAEVRERLFGSPASGAQSRESSAASQSRNTQNNDSRNSSRRGRVRGGKDSRPASAGQSPARHILQPKQLYDPGCDAKPKPQSLKLSGPKEEQPLRAPRGPDNSGRGGFGFAARGGRENA